MDNTTNPEPQAQSVVPVQPRKGKRAPRGNNPHGFRNGSDSAIIVDLLVKGGLDRQDINDKVAAAIKTETRSGLQKNIPSLISGLLARLDERGYRIESHWRLIPPDAPAAPADSDDDN